MTDVHVVTVPQLDPRLGRQCVQDERSRAFPLSATVDRATWRDKAVRIYDPLPNPEQQVGCCTGVDKAVTFNAVGNRVMGRVLRMDDALRVYALATTLDPWDGAWPPHDTGSSALAAAKAAQQLRLGGEYRWLFGLADEVVQTIMAGRTVSVGTWWYWDMFNQDATGVVTPTGGKAGGHMWTVRGYDADRDMLLGRCWWGDFRDFWISREHLSDLLADDGDALVQAVAS